MFERFTDRARRVVVLAQEEARDSGALALTTAHLLCALDAEGEGIAAKVLRESGFDASALRKQLPHGEKDSSHLPFTREVKGCFERSLREALQLGHNYIGTEHLLLAVIHTSPGLISWCTPEGLRRWVMMSLADPPVDASADLRRLLAPLVAPTLLDRAANEVLAWNEALSVAALQKKG